MTKHSVGNGVCQMMNEIQSLLSDIPQFIRGVKTYTQITMINFNDKENAVGTQRPVTSDLWN